MKKLLIVIIVAVLMSNTLAYLASQESRQNQCQLFIKDNKPYIVIIRGRSYKLYNRLQSFSINEFDRETFLENCQQIDL